MYDIEKFYQATSLQDALNALQLDPQAVIISGGSDVLIKIREGKLAGCSLVSIHGLKELEGVRINKEGTISIGPATSFSHLTKDPLIQKHIPMLGAAVDQVGGPQVRNIGTIGGNICNGATSADSATSLFVLEAELVLTSLAGSRIVPIQEFYTGPGKTVREHGEILSEIRINAQSYTGCYGHYIKYGKRNAMEIATLGCAVLVKLNGDCSIIEEFRLAYGVAAPTPIRCGATEKQIKGRLIDAQVCQDIGTLVLAEINPRSSWRASREFRLQLAKELAQRAFKQAVQYAGGEVHA